MAKLTKKAFQHFNDDFGGYIVEDEMKPLIDAEYNKIRNTLYRMAFAYKCLYPNERPLSKRDYARLKFTEDVLWNKKTGLMQKRTKSENEAFQRGMRMLQLQKGCYPFQIDVRAEIENGNEEFCKFYYEGRYKKGSFIDKFVAHLHRF